MRALRVIPIMAVSLAVLAFGTPDAHALNLYSGCQQAFRSCWDFAAYLNPEPARRHRSYCTNTLNGCQANVRLAASGAEYYNTWLFPRGTAVVRIGRNGQSVVVSSRVRR